MTARRAAAVLFLLPWLLFFSAEEGGTTSGAMDFAGKVVNFLILFGGLLYILRKPLREFLSKKVSTVEEEIRSAGELRRETEEKLALGRGRLEGLAVEIREFKDAVEEETLREKQRIARLAAEEAERLKRYSAQEIELQVRAETLELRSYAAEKAAALARERIRSRLTDEDQSRLIDESIAQLVNIHEKPGPC